MKKYLITDQHYYTTQPNSFAAALNRSLLKYNPDFVCFRDKTEGDKNALLRLFCDAIKKTDAVSLVNGSLEFALKYQFDGVHLRGDQMSDIKNVKNSGLMCIVSCHSIDDVFRAIELGCDYATLSPVFDTLNKGAPLGYERFIEMLSSLDKNKIFALGGIDDEAKADKIAASGVFGFASIRYFVR